MPWSVLIQDVQSSAISRTHFHSLILTSGLVKEGQAPSPAVTEKQKQNGYPVLGKSTQGCTSPLWPCGRAGLSGLDVRVAAVSSERGWGCGEAGKQKAQMLPLEVLQ